MNRPADALDQGQHDENCWIACPHDTPPAALDAADALDSANSHSETRP